MTHLDNIINFPHEVIQCVVESQEIRDLLANKKNATIEDIEDDEGNLRYIHDYEFVSETVTEAKTYICIDTCVKAENGTINDVSLYIHVISHKSHMGLSRSIYTGRKGNRRDNLVREIDNAIRGKNYFGIGRLQLAEVNPFVLPADFCGKTLIYTCPDFSIRRRI